MRERGSEAAVVAATKAGGGFEAVGLQGGRSLSEYEGDKVRARLGRLAEGCLTERRGKYRVEEASELREEKVACSSASVEE